jgi:hypothetical protein
MASMLHELLLLSSVWAGARLEDTPDPLKKRFVLSTHHRLGYEEWKALKRIYTIWAKQNDCVFKDIRRYKKGVTADLYIKYEMHPGGCDFSPHEELPARERHWRKINRISQEERS